jgi:hypothetical protein
MVFSISIFRQIASLGITSQEYPPRFKSSHGFIVESLCNIKFYRKIRFLFRLHRTSFVALRNKTRPARNWQRARHGVAIRESNGYLQRAD